MKKIILLLFYALISCEQDKKPINKSPLTQEELIDRTIEELQIEKSKTDFIVSKISPSNSDETIIIIPEVVNEDEDVFQLNGNIIIANNTTGKPTHTFFESPEENGWISDAIFIDDIAIDTLVYRLSDTNNAFGITTSFRSNSQPNPYNSKNMSLYVKEDNSLKKMLDNYTFYEHFGEVNVNMNACYADLKKTVSTLSVSDTKTNGFYDILVKSSLFQIIYSKDEEGECNPKEHIMSIEDIVLKFDGNLYKEETRTHRKLTSELDFNTAIANMKIKNVPLIDATNFDSFIDEDDYNKVNVQAFKLESIYPNFNKQGYNYRAVASYKIDLSNAFHSVVITIHKGDNEMESILVNYNFNGNIIDSKVVAYDEIAESMFRTQSKITNKSLIVNQVAWREEPKIEQITYQILEDGIIDIVDSKVLNDELANIPLITLALDKLKLNMLNVKTELIVSMEHPDNPDDVIIVLPEIEEETDDYLELKGHIIIINSRSGEVMQTFVKEGWLTEADTIKNIKIDANPYIVSENTQAFGVRVHRYGGTLANPYENQLLSLFLKSGDKLNSILYNYDVMDYGGERVTDCESEFLRSKRSLFPLKNKTNGYFNIEVKNTIIETKNFIDDDGKCVSKEDISTTKAMLAFNGETYK